MNYFENDLLSAAKMPTGENAWTYESIPDALNNLLQQKLIVLGGDVLTKEMEYTSDSWYYNPVQFGRNVFECIDHNCNRSVEAAREHIENYTLRNGTGYLYVFVVKKGLDAVLPILGSA